jgi:PadR family transcriptional regulator PadR
MEKILEKELNLSKLEDEEYKKFIDRIVKANREFFVLYVLADKPMCGYDVIKEIFLRCNVFLNQGNIYPILYSLEEEGILRAEFSKGNMRSKKYFLTSQGKKEYEKKLEEFVKALKFILTFVKSEG